MYLNPFAGLSKSLFTDSELFLISLVSLRENFNILLICIYMCIYLYVYIYVFISNTVSTYSLFTFLVLCLPNIS